jgi:hypothetical protein
LRFFLKKSLFARKVDWQDSDFPSSEIGCSGLGIFLLQQFHHLKQVAL